MYNYISFVCIIFISSGLFGQNKIQIAVSEDSEYLLRNLVEKYERNTHDNLEITIATTDKLYEQIELGVNYDIIICENINYLKNLCNSGYLYSEPQIVAFSELVVWTNDEDEHPFFNIYNMAMGDVKRIAFPDPTITPYGKEAYSVIKHYNLRELIENKIVFLPSLTDVNKHICSKAVEMGFVSKAHVISSEMQNVGKWMEIKNTAYSLIPIYLSLLPKSQKVSPAVLQFYNFLFSRSASKFYKRNGYTFPPTEYFY